MESLKLEPLQKIVRRLLSSQLTVFILVIISIILLTSYWAGKREVDEQKYTNSLLSERVSNYFDTAISDLKTLTYTPTTSTYLEIIGKVNNYFDVLYYINNQGELIGTYPEDPKYPVGRDMSYTPYFQADQKTTIISRPFISPNTGNPTVYISMPLETSKGIVVGELSLLGLQESLIHSQINPTGIFYIIDQDGYLIANPNYKLVQEHVDLRKSELFKKAEKGQLIQLNIIDGKIVLDVVIKNEDIHYWSIVEGSIFTLLGPFIFPSLIGLVATIAILIILIKKEEKDFTDKIVTPLVLLKSEAQRFSAGDYSSTLVSKNLNTFEEVRSLANCYSQMREAIESREKALAQEKNLLRTMIDNIPDSIYTKDKNGRKTLSNPTDVKFCGKTNESELLGKLDSEIYSSEIAGQFNISDQIVLSMGQPVLGVEEQLTDSSGQPIWIITSKLPLRDEDGNLTGLVGVGHDITERKKVEIEVKNLNAELELRVKNRTAALEEANRELESFSYSVSHDLRAPLRAIDGYSSILLTKCADNLDEQEMQYFNQIRIASQKMGTLIEDLLKLSRISRTQIILNKVDLVVIAQEIFDQLQLQDPDRNVEFIHPEKIEVNADENLITITLDNLMRNAWKFTSKKNEAKIEIGSYLDDEKQVIFIKDNGAGFEMKYVDKLFGAFQRLHDNSDYEGTGIGLAIVKRIINRHNGNIWAEGNVDQGAAFFFTLS